MKEKIKLQVSKDDDSVGYVYLPKHPGKQLKKIVSKQIDLREHVQYKGPSIYLDFDKENFLIGIEIID